MKRTPKKQSDEYTTFETALKKVLSVPYSEMKNKLASEKKRAKRPSASRASTSED